MPPILYLLPPWNTELLFHNTWECPGVFFKINCKFLDEGDKFNYTNTHFPMDPALHLLNDESKLSIPGKSYTNLSGRLD